jgi:predicted glycoside hydrolase/deacetylase ChbG (UPF0249 family)
VTSLAEALGSPPGTRLLIITCDDLGVSFGTNAAVYEALRRGSATSAGLVVPGPWARQAAASYRGEDVGAHLTLNAEYDLYRWGPVTRSPSLLDGDGGFPRTLVDLWEHADLDEVRKECRAQVERAIYWGFDVSHLSAHLGALELRPEFFDVALDLAVEFRLPLRLAGADQERAAGFPFRRLAGEEGVLSPDHLVRAPRGHSAGPALERILEDLSPAPAGVTEVVLRPALDGPELRAVMPDHEARAEDHRAGTDGAFARAVAGHGRVALTSYRALRDLQRRGT